jgi:lipopolysaccharide transport system ATP-binding protein
MTRVEIREKFDEIVSFAEIEKFIDTPVKRYSSGMYIRLAFAVAAHLEPEILIIDEVLAVGDTRFQQKCLGRIRQISNVNGRTVLFVSHQIDAIERLTDKCLYLENGRTHSLGQTNAVLSQYLSPSQNGRLSVDSFRVPGASPICRILDFHIENQSGAPTGQIRMGEPLKLCLKLSSNSDQPIDAAIVIENSKQSALFTTHLSDKSQY